MVLIRRLMEGDHHGYLPTESCGVPPCSKQGRPGTLVGAAPQILLARFPQGAFFGFWLGFGPWLSRAETVGKEKALSRHLEV